MKRTTIVAFFCLIFALSFAQPSGVLKHFSHDAKLSQSHILDIQQDQKGFIWMGTYNGLIRYDGNAFHNFEVVQRGRLNLSSNRVSSFKFDKSGRIWIKSEKEEIYYFDTQNLSFHYPLEGQSKELSKIPFRQFKLVASGRVWLFPENKNHLIVLETNNEVQQIVFDSAKLRGSKITDVFEDSTGTTWFLTDFGICKLKKGEVKPEYFLNVKKFCAVTKTLAELSFTFFNILFETVYPKAILLMRMKSPDSMK